MTGKEDTGFSFETMAVVLYCVLESGVTLGDKHYQLMSSLDGNRSANAFQHQFRKVKARAKELKARADNGGVATDATPAKGKARTPASGKKRGRKAKEDDEDQDDVEQAEESKTPSKKSKVKEEKTEEDDDGLI